MNVSHVPILRLQREGDVDGHEMFILADGAAEAWIAAVPDGAVR